MVRLILLFLLVSSIAIISEELIIPSDLTPIEGSSEILYSFEFDDKPKFIERVSESEFIVLILDDEDAQLYSYNSKTDKTELKSEFFVNPDEHLVSYKLVKDKLYLFFAFSDSDGHYKRETVINLSSYKPESSIISFTDIFEDDFEFEDYNYDMEYASKNYDKKLFLKGLEEKDIEPEEYVGRTITYNEQDSSRRNILSLIFEADEYLLYGRITNYNKYGEVGDNKLIILRDSVEDEAAMKVNYSYLDENSNLYYIMSWYNDDFEKRYISFNKITPEGKLTTTEKEIPLEIDDDEYYPFDFEVISHKGDILKLFGSARYAGEGLEEIESIASLYVATLNLSTMDFDLVSKSITEEEGEEINKGETEFKFNNVDKIVEVSDGYLVLTENSKLYRFVSVSIGVGGFNRSFVGMMMRDINGSNFTYQYHFNEINLFKLDKNLNFKWNTLIEERGIETDYFLFGNPYNSFSSTPVQAVLKPEVNNESISFIYSTSEPEDQIIRAKYDINSGELMESVSLFENDGTASYYPGYQYPIGNKEFVTLLAEDDFFIVKYKLLK